MLERPLHRRAPAECAGAGPSAARRRDARRVPLARRLHAAAGKNRPRLSGRRRMASYAWVLEVRPGYEEEYKKRHDEIWPEMIAALRAAGIRNYNIFRHGLTLFGYFETDDLERTITILAKDPVNARWG